MAVLPYTECTVDDVGMGQTVRGVFPLTNRGGERLIVTRIHPGCDCVAPAEPQIIVGPGESVDLVVALADDGDRPGQSESLYTTNAPNLPRFSLKIRAIPQCARRDHQPAPYPDSQAIDNVQTHF